MDLEKGRGIGKEKERKRKMFPPAQTLNLDITAISGICGLVCLSHT